MMPNNDTTRLVVTASEPEHVGDLVAFVQKYLRLDQYQPVNPPGRVDDFTGEPLPERLDEPKLSHAFMPMPLEYVGTVEGTNRVTAADGRTWMDWASDHWGTKWGTYDESHEVSDDRIVITFNSAWNPPWKLLETLGFAYPTLRFGGTWLSEYDCMLRRFEFGAYGGVSISDIGKQYSWPDDDGEPTQQFHLDGTPVETTDQKPTKETSNVNQ